MENSQKPPFPWTFLSLPDGPDAELAAVWIFRHLQGRAYKGYLEAGPGILVGPFFSDEEDVPITTGEAIRRRANNETVGIAVMYLPVLSPQFSEMVTVESVRETVHVALGRYNPESQCVVLLRHDDAALSVSIVGFEAGSNGQRSAWGRELPGEFVPGGFAKCGLPN